MTRFAVRHPVAVLVLAVSLVTAGLISYATLPREAGPDIKIPNIIVTVPWFGVSPEDIESLVTHPLEQELGEIKDVEVMTSTSAEGAAMINVQFAPHLRTSDALQRVRDAVGRAKPDLPVDAEDPVIAEISFSDFPILLVFLSGDYSPVRLRALGEQLQDLIEGIEGVLAARVAGGLERQVQVDVDPYRLAHHGLTLSDVVASVQGENVNMPGGNLEEGDVGFLLRVPAELTTAAELSDIVVKTKEGAPIRLDQIASVRDGFAEPATHSRIRGVPGISIGVTKRAGANLPAIVDEVKRRIGELSPTFPAGTRVAYLADQSKDIRIMVRELENSILSGLVLVLLVLFLFLGGRNSVFVAISIPLSMLMSFVVLSFMGITLNMIVLFSLILALGMLVDNAIVIVENIYRHTQLGSPRAKAALDGAAEVAWPVITSTITTLCAFGPLLFWPGIMGEFMGYLPQTLIITLSASLFVALVVNPVVCALFMRPGAVRLDEGEPALLRGYRWALDLSLRHRYVAAAASFAALIGTFMAYGALNAGVEFFPEVTPRKVFVGVRAPDGTNLAASDRIVSDVEALLAPESNVLEYVAEVGAGAGQGNPMGSSGGGVANDSRVTVDFHEPESWTENPFETIARLRHGVQTRLAGADIRVDKQEMGPPAGAPVNIEIAGDDYAHLAAVAERIKRKISPIPGLKDVRDDHSAGRPELRVHVDRALASQLGIANTAAIGGVVRTAIAGRTASKIREMDEERDIVVRLGRQFRSSLPDLAALEVDGKDGKRIRLADVARLSTSTGTGSIRHIDSKRVVTVSGDVEGANANEVLQQVQAALTGFDAGAATLSYTGENKEQDKAKSFLLKALLAALALIALVLVTQFNSVTQPAIILASVILSLIGVLWGLVITGTPFGVVMTGIGVISLAGVVVNNSIVLLDYMNQLRREGMPLAEAIREAGVTRLRPVLLTAVTTVLGLFPMATGYGFDFIEFKVQVGGQSAEWWSPMAIAVIFGLAVATLLTLVVVPVMYSILEGWKISAGELFERQPILRGVALAVGGLLVVGVVFGIVSGAVAMA